MLAPRLGGSRLGDQAVVDTNDDAQLSKLSCVRHGYFQDAFVHHFVRRPTRRSPLINRGYYSRYAALRNLLLQFLAVGKQGNGSSNGSSGHSGSSSDGSSGSLAGGSAAQPASQAAGNPAEQPAQSTGQQQQQQQQPADPPPAAAGQAGSQQPSSAAQQQADGQQPQGSGPQQQGEAPLRRQVLVLGAGYDTAYFQLAAAGIRADKYIEVDFLQVTQKKAAAIQQLPDLLELIGGPDAASSISPEEGRIVTDSYCLLPVDLREPGQLAAALEAAGLDPAAPTYVLSECVLVYMRPQHSREVVRWLAEHLHCAAMVVYEQINPHDAFGQQMLLNLESRGCALLGIEATPSLDSQRQRFLECGWHRAETRSMDHVYSQCIDPADRRRIERLEIFDEFEEWHLIQQHYCIAIGVKDSSGLLARFGLPQFAQPQVLLPQSAGLGGGGRMPPPPPPPRFMM
ncbi:tRNA wybutosine-synthesizing 4 [Chlorella sorokiniana]|uniref:[phosphatase 2A protein]-leucine-carboxy methyltransferase n=1 Tax=Chlorella sorokiniana TaxID=3076 RepID=A0A2P6TLE3_CHLSO|nr:tRNA wybutosine-synthesizing 4 [Chlorella sorokiniana]|eukprot:PRW45066.1 tRNA wybutosine-synthesizing 4 [Chlorella sorokiniana]